jgi:hypothetical protein
MRGTLPSVPHVFIVWCSIAASAAQHFDSIIPNGYDTLQSGQSVQVGSQLAPATPRTVGKAERLLAAS